MPTLNITKYPVAGIIADVNAVELGESYLTHVSNARMSNGGITPTGGYKHLEDLDAGIVPQYIQPVTTPSSSGWIIACESDILMYKTVGSTSIKPSDTMHVSAPYDWSGVNLSSIPIINHEAIGPHYLGASESKLLPLPWSSGKTWSEMHQSCKFIAAHKQYLFALGLTDNNKEIPDGVRWSSPADVGDIPATWDPIDTTNVAGLVTLGGTGGAIVSGLSLRDSFVVYRTNGISIFEYVGGIYVWRIRHLSSNVGLISPHGVVDVNGTHYFISDGDIYMNDGNTVHSIANDRIRSRLNAVSKSSYRSAFAIHHQQKKEVWFCLPIGDTKPKFAYIYNYEYDSWMMRDFDCINAAIGTLTAEDSIWDNSHEEWNASNKTWYDNATSPYDTSMLGIRQVGTGYSLFIIDVPVGFNTEAFSTIIERTDIPIGGIGVVNTIQRIYPRVTGNSNISIQLGCQFEPGGPVYWKPPVLFEPNKDRKVDVRSTGSLHAYRITSTDSTANFILTGLDFEYVEAGTR